MILHLYDHISFIYKLTSSVNIEPVLQPIAYQVKLLIHYERWWHVCPVTLDPSAGHTSCHVCLVRLMERVSLSVSLLSSVLKYGGSRDDRTPQTLVNALLINQNILDFIPIHITQLFQTPCPLCLEIEDFYTVIEYLSLKKPNYLTTMAILRSACSEHTFTSLNIFNVQDILLP